MRAFVITIAVIQTLAVGMNLANAKDTSLSNLIANASIGAWAWWLVLA